MTALWSAIPAVILLTAWMIFEPGYLNSKIIESLPVAIAAQSPEAIDLYVNNVLLAVANGGLGDDQGLRKAAAAYLDAPDKSRLLVSALVLVLCVSGILFAFTQYLTRQHARKRDEGVVRVLLALCSLVAIVTTVGIVLSVLYEAVRFFEAELPLRLQLARISWQPCLDHVDSRPAHMHRIPRAFRRKRAIGNPSPPSIPGPTPHR